jgi:hypothetical protein
MINDDNYTKANTDRSDDEYDMYDGVETSVTEDLDEMAEEVVAMIERSRERRAKQAEAEQRARSVPKPTEGLFCDAFLAADDKPMIRVVTTEGFIELMRESQYTHLSGAIAEAVLEGVKRSGGEPVYCESGKLHTWQRDTRDIKDLAQRSDVEDVMAAITSYREENSAPIRRWNFEVWGEPRIDEESIAEYGSIADMVPSADGATQPLIDEALRAEGEELGMVDQVRRSKGRVF